MAKIFYKKGVTINTGNFENERVELGIEIDMASESIPDLTEEVDSLKDYVNKKLDEYTSGIKKPQKKVPNSDLVL